MTTRRFIEFLPRDRRPAPPKDSMVHQRDFLDQTRALVTHWHAMTGSRDQDLAGLRKLAEEMAKARNERPTTGHLLAAIASTTGGAADLLKKRHLEPEMLLKAARFFEDDDGKAVGRALQRARDLAARSPMRDPNAIHLLYALCHERETVAAKAIAQCGLDVAKLRTAAMQVAMGIVLSLIHI